MTSEEERIAIERLPAATGGSPASFIGASDVEMAGALDHAMDALVAVAPPRASTSRVEYIGLAEERITYMQFVQMHQGGKAIVRQFQHDKIRIALNWVGLWENPKTVPRNQAPIWRVTVQDRIVTLDDQGQEHDTFTPPHIVPFPTRAAASPHYEAMVKAYTDSYEDAHGKLIEVGNQLGEPDPNVPLSAAAVDDELGAW